MKKKYLLFGILTIIAVQIFAQKPDETVKTGEYEIEGIYDPNLKPPTPENISPAAIGLASFEGRYIEGQSFVELTWVISKKFGTFIIEHSIDGKKYYEIGEVDNTVGFENSLYTFEAREFGGGINFYRLKQIVNSKAIYSEVKAITVSEKDDAIEVEYSDKEGVKRIQLRSREIQQVVIQLYDAEGNLQKELFNQDMTVNEIIFRDIKKNDFIPGNYFVLIKGEHFKQSKKIILP